MRLVFFGTGEFAVPALERILNSNHELAAVVTQPDRKKGRKLVMTPPPVKAALKGVSIPLHQPEDASDRETIALIPFPPGM